MLNSLQEAGLVIGWFWTGWYNDWIDVWGPLFRQWIVCSLIWEMKIDSISMGSGCNNLNRKWREPISQWWQEKWKGMSIPEKNGKWVTDSIWTYSDSSQYPKNITYISSQGVWANDVVTAGWECKVSEKMKNLVFHWTFIF